MALVENTDDGAKRNVGPVVVMYADATNPENKRIPVSVTGVTVADRHNGKKVYDILALPEQVRQQLIAFAFAQRVKIYATNSSDDTGSNVLESADKVYADLVAGNFYSRAEGGAKVGRTFNPSIWIETMREVANLMAAKDKTGAKKPATEEQLEMLRTKLISVTPVDRRKLIEAWKTKPVINAVYRKIEAQRAQMDAKGKALDSDTLDDIF